MILGVIAIFLASCHNVNAAESDFPSNKIPNRGVTSLIQPKKGEPLIKRGPPITRAPRFFDDYKVKINQAADLRLDLRTFAVASK